MRLAGGKVIKVGKLIARNLITLYEILQKEQDEFPRVY
jgi:hypothetical protein